MKKTLFTALSPNAQKDDVALSFSLWFQPWKWRKGKSLPALQKFLADLIGVPYVFLFESGRTALYTLLKSLDLPQGAEVLLQAYTCVAVPEPVLWCGLKPVYVDCDEETLTMSVSDLEKKITSRSKVLIIQHTLGNPANLDGLLAVARKHHLFVVEDCAHALGALYKGKPVGSFGDASFFSFGRDKVVSSVFGGALLVKALPLAQKLEKFVRAYKLPSRRWILQQLLHPVLMGLVKATYDFYVGKVLLKMFQALHFLSKAVYPEERFGKKPFFIGHSLPNGLAMLALHQLKKLRRFHHHRAMLAAAYDEFLKNLPLRKVKIEQDAEPVYLRYTFKTARASALLQDARKEKMYLGDWYTTAIAPADVDFDKIRYNPLSCPVAEKMAKETVNLPTHMQIDTIDQQRIVTFLKRFYGTSH